MRELQWSSTSKQSTQLPRKFSGENLPTDWSLLGLIQATDQVQFLLKTNGDGTLLELEQRSNDKTDWWFGAGVGWESALID